MDNEPRPPEWDQMDAALDALREVTFGNALTVIAAYGGLVALEGIVHYGVSIEKAKDALVDGYQTAIAHALAEQMDQWYETAKQAALQRDVLADIDQL